ncbi:exonuclease domain-containing protein [Aequorivita marina]|uniref:exonuclease domain-containing protein n=1 Tax=Aequorivita marina TaxID=3073654 RepID=UPI002874BFEA|nr:exonuclease domain-containing protein [Aequorivita sp. S2608]MDS1298720.1 bifunctional DNA primase/polymerase [Aequorivita sp. S2608]
MLNNKILANHFYKLGLNITCIANYVTENNFYDANILKGPYHEWKHLKHERQSLSELENYDWDNAVGIGTIAGFENLHILDIDGCSNYEFIEDLLIILGLPKSYQWVVKTGSLDGYHIYFFSDLIEVLEEDQVASSYPPNLDNTALFEKIELLWSTHIVLPNSLHKSGSKYSFANCKFPKEKPTFIDINKFKIIESLFLNISEIEKKKVYFSLSKEKHRNVTLPNNINLIDLSNIEENLFFLFDIETDGLIKNGKYPNIVQVSWMIMDTNGIVYKKNTELVNSDFNENSDAFKINKLNPSIIKKIGKQPSDVFLDMTYDLKHCKIISAHNLKFDLSILENEFRKYQIDFNFDSLERFCTMDFGTELLSNEFNPEPKFPKLTELFEHLFNHKIKQFHNANSDVTILAKCVKELLYKGNLEKLKT